MDTLMQDIGHIACSAVAAITRSVPCATMSEVRSAGYIAIAAMALLIVASFIFRARRI